MAFPSGEAANQERSIAPRMMVRTASGTSSASMGRGITWARMWPRQTRTAAPAAPVGPLPMVQTRVRISVATPHKSA
jgi:hypothetical protein